MIVISVSWPDRRWGRPKPTGRHPRWPGAKARRFTNSAAAKQGAVRHRGKKREQLHTATPFSTSVMRRSSSSSNLRYKLSIFWSKVFCRRFAGELTGGFTLACTARCRSFGFPFICFPTSPRHLLCLVPHSPCWDYVHGHRNRYGHMCAAPLSRVAVSNVSTVSNVVWVSNVVRV